LKKLYLHIIILFLLKANLSFAQTIDSLYQNAFVQLSQMLDGKQKLDFKKAVFLVENAYENGNLDSVVFNQNIKFLANLTEKVIENNQLIYNEKDSVLVKKLAGIFYVMKDSVPMINQSGKRFVHIPFTYDFNDIFGKLDWRQMFVSKLLETHTGNCHSLPYLYKMIAQELGIGEQVHLALAPNHFYIKTRSEAYGWYNTELTSGIFPNDAWLMASGYVHLDAVVNGVYMKALDEKQSIALCMVDLAQAYQKNKFYDTDFVIKCADKALEVYPNLVNAMLVKTEATGHKIDNILTYKYNTDFSKVLQYEETAKMFYRLQDELKKIHQLGYRQMPEEMYLQWLVSLKEEKEKYSNKKIRNFTKSQ